MSSPPELRQDPVTGRWVIISPERQKRPQDLHVAPAKASNRDDCPFCPGHEAMTPPEIMTLVGTGPERVGTGLKAGPNLQPGPNRWDVRVVPNMFPALTMDGSRAVGTHEVIVESPDHDASLASLSVAQLTMVLAAWRERIVSLSRDARLQYIQVFKNHGAFGGATLEHPHSQIIALPFVPDVVRAEIDGARRHFAAHGRCVFCDIVRDELADGRRVVEAHADFVAVAAYAPRFPFETWLLPKRHGSRFEEATAHDLDGLARLLKAVLQRIDAALGAPPFNLVLHTAPVSEDVAAEYHWHMEILPALTRPGGFEWGTGAFVNPMAPEDAAAALRKIHLKLES